ncbi:MAG: RnfABCDGE type electron transport complex subunit G [Ruminococcaceae bacterium]|nr:RnfABCDGE type electron transport complex subunit G [Oscillospiraceae bacterium]
MTETKNTSTVAYVLKLGVILFLICAITAGLLGFVNSITEDRIAEITAEKTAKAMSTVLPADAYDEVEYTGSDALVVTAYKASTGGSPVGYVVEVTPSGFGGTIDMVVGVDMNGAVTGVDIIDMSETSGLGANASKASFREQYIGGTGNFAVSKDGGTIDALTGATVTSRAVTSGVNAAVAAAATLG